jgi:hypothetical protein
MNPGPKRRFVLCAVQSTRWQTGKVDVDRPYQLGVARAILCGWIARRVAWPIRPKRSGATAGTTWLKTGRLIYRVADHARLDAKAFRVLVDHMAGIDNPFFPLVLRSF